MLKPVKLSDTTHAQLTALKTRCHARSRDVLVARMCDYFEQRGLNPMSAEQPVSVQHELHKLRNTVIGFYRTQEQETYERVERQLREVRRMAEQVHAVAHGLAERQDALKTQQATQHQELTALLAPRHKPDYLRGQVAYLFAEYNREWQTQGHRYNTLEALQQLQAQYAERLRRLFD